MHPKISVTIPVYNTSKYLRQCFDSLKGQTMPDIEFIVVDDGSTDDSSIICDEYAASDSRFKVIHKSNGGLSSARQCGLDNAKGEYIIVCDSDDWVELDMYKLLYEKAIKTNADIAICGFYTEYENNYQSINYRKFIEVNGFVDNYDIIKHGAGSSWVKLIKRSLFEDANINYEPGINVSEDSLITYKIMQANPKVVQIDQPLYHYRRIFGGNSYTNSLSMEHIYQMNFTYYWLKANYNIPQYYPIIINRAIDLAFACLRVRDLDTKYFHSLLKNELSYKAIFQYMPTLKCILILNAKIISVRLSQYIVKLLYPFFYK